MSTKLPEPPSSYSQTWASQTLRLLERALTTITGIQTTLSELPTTYQPLDATLTALAAFNTNGLLTQTSENTFTGRTITGTANEITVTNGDGVSGNPTLSLPAALTFTGKTVTGGTFNSGAFNGTVGATTPSTGAFTTITSSSTTTLGTGAGFVIVGTGDTSRKFTCNGFARFTDGTVQFEIVNGGGVGFIGTNNNYPVAVQVNAVERARFTTTGFDVTGTFSCTGNATLGDASADTVDVKGRIFGSNLHDNAAGLSGASYIGSGTYTPTITGVTNVAATTAYVCQYLRVGNVVTVSGRIDVDAATVTTTTEVRISLPIASDFIAVGNLGGTGVYEFNFEPVRIYADAVNNQAFFQFLPQNTANQTLVFHFTYVVL